MGIGLSILPVMMFMHAFQGMCLFLAVQKWSKTPVEELRTYSTSLGQ